MELIVETGEIATLTLNRPERANAYGAVLLQAFNDALDRVETSARVLIIAASGNAFCGGADLKEMAGCEPTDALDLRSQRTFNRLAAAPFVSIAVIQGAAVGGGLELALAADLRIGGPKARFWLPEPELGLIPSAGGTTRLTRAVGPARAKEVILGGVTLDAATAASWGLLSRVVKDPLGEARTWAQQILRRDALALRLAKRIIDRGEDAGSLYDERLAEALLYQRKLK